jgi:hypothetical protein
MTEDRVIDMLGFLEEIAYQLTRLADMVEEAKLDQDRQQNSFQ